MPLVRPALLVGLLAIALGFLFWPGLAARLIHAPRAEAAMEALQRDRVIREAVLAQNSHLATAPDAYTTAMDETWLAEKSRGGGPIIDAMLALPASERLRAIVAASGGAVRHVIVMDARGRNVAIPFPTSDYFQGDEQKWLATYGRAPGTRHVAPPERGHDGSFAACWLSIPLNDAETGAALGAASFELDAALVGNALCRPTP
jgi:hypothetical protein